MKHCEYPRYLVHGRREYPDVPGLFDARFSQYNQPSLARELQRTWLVLHCVLCHSSNAALQVSLLGLALLLAGCGVLLWNEGRAVRTAAALEG